jgi:hypothetical protein
MNIPSIGTVPYKSFTRLTFVRVVKGYYLDLAIGRTGFRFGSRGLFHWAKGRKAISIQDYTLNRSDADRGGVDQPLWLN